MTRPRLRCSRASPPLSHVTKNSKISTFYIAEAIRKALGGTTAYDRWNLVGLRSASISSVELPAVDLVIPQSGDGIRLVPYSLSKYFEMMSATVPGRKGSVSGTKSSILGDMLECNKYLFLLHLGRYHLIWRCKRAGNVVQPRFAAAARERT